MGDGTLFVNLSVSNGVLSLSETAGLTIACGDATMDARRSIRGPTICFEGALDDVNAALANMRYVSDFDYYGPDTLTVVVQDAHLGSNLKHESPLPEAIGQRDQVRRFERLQLDSHLVADTIVELHQAPTTA